MAKLWAGRNAGETDLIADKFNSSIAVDQRMIHEDIEGSMAHARMLARQGIISGEDCTLILKGLESILKDIDDGMPVDETAEDVHMFVEAELTKRIGDAGKRLHTARSRNDQVALDLRMTMRNMVKTLRSSIKALLEAILKQAQSNIDTVMPGYTHLQRAQPVTFAHHILAYAMMLMRDDGRLTDAAKRMNQSPIGACALAGSSYPVDRAWEAEQLGFDSICLNSMDAVSDRDYALEILSGLSILMMHLSRLAEEIVLFSSWEFQFIELDDAYTTGSSIMPQKKNPDMAELVRGKCGRVYGALMGLLTTMKGLPLCYNKDMQEDKTYLFDAVDQVKDCLEICEAMIATLRVKPDRMLSAARRGFINATDAADYLTRKGVPFRTAYGLIGAFVSKCIEKGCTLEEMPLSEWQKVHPLFEKDIYEAIDLVNCVNRRSSPGGSGRASVTAQIAAVREYAAAMADKIE